MNIKKSIKLFKHRGALFVEAALVLPLLIYLVINMIYFALFLHDYVGLNNMTRNSVRLAAVEASALTDNSTNNEQSNQSELQTRTNRVKKYLRDGIAEELTIYNLNINSIAAANRPSEITASGGYVFTSGENQDVICVVLAADRTEDYPIIVNNAIPRVIVSSLKMKLER